MKRSDSSRRMGALFIVMHAQRKSKRSTVKPVQYGAPASKSAWTSTAVTITGLERLMKRSLSKKKNLDGTPLMG